MSYSKLLKQRAHEERWGLIRLILAPFVGALYVVLLGFRLVSWLVAQVWQWIRTEIYWLKVKAVIGHFQDALTLRKSQLIVMDQYGVNTSGWEREKIVFVKRFLTPFPKTVTLQSVTRFIDKQLKRLDDEFRELPLVETAMEFEKFCADELQKAGWQTARTKGSGDQGIDIAATKDGISAVFQCKWYSQPVGNKAVQEVLAGKLFQEADYAIVLTNSRFTQAATHLANRTGVHLLHHTQIREFTTRMSAAIPVVSG